MTNPNDSVGTNGAYGGRTSVNALNDVLASFTGRGVLSGWGVTASSGMTVNVGGSAGVRDVAIAEDNAGNRTTVDNRSSSPISVTLSAASASSTRIDCIVAYVNNPATVLVTTIDNPSACGIIAVNGTTSAPDDAAIRSAITADGGTGSTAYYVVLATITIAAGTTDLTDSNIAQGDKTSTSAVFSTLVLNIPNEQTLTTKDVEYTVNFRVTAQKSGTGLIAGANAVRIGAGVSKIMVSGQIYWFDNINSSGQAAGSMCVQYIYKNGDIAALVNGRSATNYFVRAFGNLVLDVQEGDIISMKAKNQHSDGSSIGPNPGNTWLSVVAIG